MTNANTINSCMSAIRALGCAVSYSEGEFRVTPPCGLNAASYFTDCRHDALATARMMRSAFDAILVNRALLRGTL